MKLVCRPDTSSSAETDDGLHVVLYGQAGSPDRGSAGDAVKSEIQRRRLVPTARAWDLLSIALSVVTADFAGLRDHSPRLACMTRAAAARHHRWHHPWPAETPSSLSQQHRKNPSSRRASGATAQRGH